MKQLFLTLAVVVVAVTACQKDAVYQNTHQEIPVETYSTSPYFVSKEVALNNLNVFMDAFEGCETRSGRRGVKNIREVSIDNGYTRSSLGEEAVGLYIVEFENGKGSAILGADKRLEPIYAVLDETVMTPSDFENAIKGVNMDDVSTFTASVIVNSVRDSKFEKDSLILIPPGGTTPGDDLKTEVYNDVEIKTVTSYIPPLLNTTWSQKGIYNDKFAVNDNCEDGRQPAGCATIALGQLLNYNRHPSPIDLNKNRFYWRDINQFTHNNTIVDSTLIEKMSFFIYHLSKELNVRYVGNITNAYFFNVTQVMRNLGYNNLSRGDITESRVYNMLYNLKPVFVAGETAGGAGHMWIIDGWKVVKTNYVRITYDNNVEISRELFDSYTTNFVHCNMGWGGRCNGYYTMNIYDTTQSRKTDELDPNCGDESDSCNAYNYDREFKCLTYDL